MSKTSTQDIEKLALESMKKLVSARKFCEIDHKILDLSLNSNSVSGDYFTQVLSLESTRLKFKEDILECTREKTLPGMRA